MSNIELQQRPAPPIIVTTSKTATPDRYPSSLANRWSERRAILSGRPRVLLVDDHPDMLKAVSRLLALYEVVGSVADSSAQANGATERA